ncbi:MAG: S-methyl-5-thioribose-1-phosphate isomerase, partial [Lentisphaeria bacterium]
MSNKQLLSIPPTLQWLTSNKQTFNTPGAAAEVLGSLDIIDQTKLPQHYERIQLSTPESIFTAIQTLAVRGAPAIGCAAALGLAACAQRIVSCQNSCDLLEKITKIAAYLDTSRPTAINLHWALQRCLNAIKNETSSAKLKQRLLDEALTIVAEDIKMCSQIGQNGLALLSPDCTVLTHCNAGALATAGIGTALAPIYAANAAGYTVRVYSDETRPLLQGARLTAWELNAAGIDTTTICDSMAAQLMQKKKIDIVIV